MTTKIIESVVSEDKIKLAESSSFSSLSVAEEGQFIDQLGYAVTLIAENCTENA